MTVWGPGDAEAFRTLGIALSHMTHGLALYGADERLVLCNDRYGQLLDLPADMLRVGLPHEDVVRILASREGVAEDAAALEARIGRIIRQRRTAMATGSGDGRAELTVGERGVSVRYQAIPDGGWVVVLEDVTERRRDTERILLLSRFDPLTGLGNRTTFHETLVATVGHGLGGAVLCLDLDRFKPVNDALGHEAGDEVLRAVAGRIGDVLGDGGEAARLGGDEFAVLLAGPPDATTAAAVATRLIAAVARPIPVRGSHVTVGISIGIRLLRDPVSSPETLLGHADLALYRAKEGGRGCFRFFEPTMAKQARWRRTLESALRGALARREFALRYQPIVHTATRRLTGFEALLRWSGRDRGEMAPADFIPFAEEIGLMPEIGDWVLRTACRDAANWPAHLTLSVNLSPTQLARPDFVAGVRGVLDESGLRPDRLEVEITETAAMRDIDRAARVLRELRRIGVEVALDDFGTGCSSLSFLRRLPFTRLKIDRSFVRDLQRDPDALAIVRALTGLCADLGVRATAEGVESERQAALLRAERCGEMQGFLIGRPVPPDAVARVIARLSDPRHVRPVLAAE